MSTVSRSELQELAHIFPDLYHAFAARDILRVIRESKRLLRESEKTQQACAEENTRSTSDLTPETKVLYDKVMQLIHGELQPE